MFIFIAGYLDVHIGFLFDVSSSFRAPASKLSASNDNRQQPETAMKPAWLGDGPMEIAPPPGVQALCLTPHYETSFQWLLLTMVQ